ncbi:MAG: hypothetical protein QM737_16460 [Ferruginibacter sp.]
MKKILLGMLVLAAITGTSCKKDKDKSCEKSVAGIAGNYKVTKYESVAGSQTQDQTSSFFTACDLNGIYALKADKTWTYTETGTCTGTDNGTWDVTDGKITVKDASGFTVADNLPITTWDCTTLVVFEGTNTSAGDVGFRTYYTKQ